MNDKVFGSPVFVKDSHTMVQEIADLADALDYLDEWPADRRGTIYDTARRACVRAHDGLLPVLVAREAFAGWARSARIHEDVSAVLPWMAGHKPGRGGMPA